MHPMQLQRTQFMTDFSFPPFAFTPVIFAISITLAGFYLYHYTATEGWLHRTLTTETSPTRYWVQRIFTQKLWGFVIMGIVPAMLNATIYNVWPADYGLQWPHLLNYLLWLLPAFLIPVAINYFLARNTQTHRQYPQMRIAQWKPLLFLINALGWLLYLTGYEYLFRGILLFTLSAAFGAWPAIVISVAIYSLAHLPKGIGETLGAIPFGIIISIIALYTGTIFFAIVIHWALAVSTDYFSIRYNPAMSFIKKKKR